MSCVVVTFGGFVRVTKCESKQLYVRADSTQRHVAGDGEGENKDVELRTRHQARRRKRPRGSGRASSGFEGPTRVISNW